MVSLEKKETTLVEIVPTHTDILSIGKKGRLK